MTISMMETHTGRFALLCLTVLNSAILAATIGVWLLIVPDLKSAEKSYAALEIDKEADRQTYLSSMLEARKKIRRIDADMSAHSEQFLLFAEETSKDLP